MTTGVSGDPGGARAGFDPSPETLRRRLSSFIESRTACAPNIEALRRYPSGMSWMTFGFDAQVGSDASAPLILRVGDPHGLLAPYSARPEFLALTALAGQPGLPIPMAFWYSDDDRDLGAPFIVTQRVAGTTPLPWQSSIVAGGPRDVGVAHDFTDALAAIHRYDWRAGAMEPLARGVTGDNAARRVVERWALHAQCDGARAPPQMRYAMRWLEAHAPRSDRVCVVHGDYRVGNFLQQDGRISAILDWELVHLGDRHEDLAWASSRTFSGGTGRVGGLIPHEEFFARYEAMSGLRVDRQAVDYYEVLTQFKLAALLLGGMRRIDDGRARDIRMAAAGFQLTRTLLDLGRSIEALR